jgi:hypothetical protein
MNYPNDPEGIGEAGFSSKKKQNNQKISCAFFASLQ